ncbi:MAG TPA: FKBP-type peptidyl-prolyl cis-trans isomerase [Steroidobacteraceae bacterium]
MNCAVGSIANTSPLQRNSLTDTGRSARVANGLTAAALLAGALLLSAGPSAAQAPKAGATAAQPAQGSTAKKPAAKSGAPAAGEKGAAAGAASDKSQASYAIGVSVGTELHRSGVAVEDISAERVAAGLRDALGGKTQMSQEYQQSIMGMLRKAHEQQAAVRAKEAEPNHTAAAAFLAENGKKKDIVTTASGLEYKVIAPGSGEPPKPGDMVTVNYKGTLLNGTEFDSSAKHGGPATFPSNGVIKGWQEALALMKPGSKYQLWIPPALAYDVESPPTIPPGSMLIFEVELLSIKPAAAAATPPAGHPQIQPAQPAQPSSK